MQYNTNKEVVYIILDFFKIKTYLKNIKNKAYISTKIKI